MKSRRCEPISLPAVARGRSARRTRQPVQTNGLLIAWCIGPVQQTCTYLVIESTVNASLAGNISADLSLLRTSREVMGRGCRRLKLKVAYVMGEPTNPPSCQHDSSPPPAHCSHFRSQRGRSLLDLLHFCTLPSKAIAFLNRSAYQHDDPHTTGTVHQRRTRHSIPFRP